MLVLVVAAASARYTWSMNDTKKSSTTASLGIAAALPYMAAEPLSARAGFALTTSTEALRSTTNCSAICSRVPSRSVSESRSRVCNEYEAYLGMRRHDAQVDRVWAMLTFDLPAMRILHHVGDGKDVELLVGRRERQNARSRVAQELELGNALDASSHTLGSIHDLHQTAPNAVGES